MGLDQDLLVEDVTGHRQGAEDLEDDGDSRPDDPRFEEVHEEGLVALHLDVEEALLEG